MKETILGIEQKRAVELGLDVTDVVLLDVIGHKLASESTEKQEIEGRQYVWVCYQSIIEWLPILGLKKRALALRLDKLVGKGILKKFVAKEKGNFTFFALCDLNDIPMPSELQRVCNANDKPMSTKLHTKSNRDKVTEIREKEKDITKVISKKKETTTADFNNEIEVFKNYVDSDQEFAYSLRHYHIKSVSKLVEKFKLHILNNGLVGDFMSNGYQRNKGWMLRVIPKLDVSDITGVTLGKGEYLKDGRRWYLNRNGKEIEVPMDAPPRRQGTIWYKEQGRWGPDI